VITRATIVGSGHTRFGRLDGCSLEDLIREAAVEALNDACMSGSAVDAVWLGHFNSGLTPESFCSSMILGADECLLTGKGGAAVVNYVTVLEPVRS
jgi:acetyl-CoA C-acetyltransferase